MQLTAIESAEMCGIARSTFTSYVSRGQAPAAAGFDPETGERVWNRAELEDWMNTRPGRRGRPPSRR
jgi:predicted DNA-binding transcriptional regulator AlpA